MCYWASKLFFFVINENMLIKKLLLKGYKYISLAKVIRISNYLNIKIYNSVISLKAN